MKAYIIYKTDPSRESYNDEGIYALKAEDDTILYFRHCSNRAFANIDLTRGIQKTLQENGITEVQSNGVTVWKDGEPTRQTVREFRAADEEYQRINSDAR